MNDIDFLPIEYHQKYARRQSRPWQIFVAIAIAGLVTAAALAQRYRQHRVESDQATIRPVYEMVVSQQTRLADLNKQGKSAKARAELYTYLRHPWPRTQLLSALVTPLPEPVTLQQIQIMREAKTAGAGAATPPPPTDRKAEEDRLKGLAPAARDRLTLAGRLDPLQTVVLLTGTATDVAALHRYIGDLDATRIFDKAELDFLSSAENSKAGEAIQFRAVLVVEPGYGQPGGPTEAEKKNLARNGSVPKP
jgi:hypothetical protein